MMKKILAGLLFAFLSANALAVDVTPGLSVPGTNLQTSTASTSAVSITSGFGTSPAISGANGYLAFAITIGSGGTDSTGILTMPFAAPNGWACTASDITTQSTTISTTQQIATGSSTTAVALTNFNDLKAPGPWVAGDVIAVNCQPY